MKGRIDAYDKRRIESARKEIKKKSLLFTDPKERSDFVSQERSGALQKYDSGKKDDETMLLIAVYDFERKRIVTNGIWNYTFTEVEAPHIEIGSGRDGANMYLSTKTQGLSADKLGIDELVFYVLNAHAMSTVNVGVGGTPNIVLINEKKSTVLSHEETSILTNLSGAYMAEIIPREKMEDFVKKSLSKKTGYTKKIEFCKNVAKELDVTVNTLTSATIPAGVWQERANHKRTR